MGMFSIDRRLVNQGYAISAHGWGILCRPAIRD
jgi:hypothetical protein